MPFYSEVVASNNGRQRRRAARRRAVLRMALLFSQFETAGGVRGNYCFLNQGVPVLKMFLSGEETRRDFRLSRPTLHRLISTLGEGSDHGWGKTLEVLVFLYWLASATYYRVVSEAFDMPRSTVCDVVHKVSREIRGIGNRIIRFPTGDELEEIGAGFARLAGSPAFSCVAGSIDCCHIRFVPPAENQQDYFNRKLFHSIHMQAICDHRGRFLNLFTGFPGSVHDARVLRRLSVYLQRQYPPQNWILLEDGGYPCIAQPVAIITLYREPVRDLVHARFNKRLSKARCVVERAFGVMKTRWRSIFLKALEVKLSLAVRVITCCAILHNLCLENGDILEPEDDDDSSDDDGHVEANLTAGDQLRECLAAAVSAPAANIPALSDHDYLVQ